MKMKIICQWNNVNRKWNKKIQWNKMPLNNNAVKMKRIANNGNEE